MPFSSSPPLADMQRMSPRLGPDWVVERSVLFCRMVIVRSGWLMPLWRGIFSSCIAGNGSVGDDLARVVSRGCCCMSARGSDSFVGGGPPGGDLDESYINIANDAEKLAEFFEVFIGA
eukprot:scaffold248417_cov67-Attheya_sp.AAC.2